MLNYMSDHYCPAYKRVISADLCYDSLCCLGGLFKIEANHELNEIDDIEKAKLICAACEYSDLGGGMDEWDGNVD